MRTAMLKLHFSILLAGFTGVFGKWIQITEVPLVWWRVVLTLAALYAWLRFRGVTTRPDKRLLPAMFGVGALQTLHWILFYASIKISTVSVALVCFSLMGFFTAIFSPLILKTKWSAREFLFSLVTILGIGLIFHFDTQYRLGIVVGVTSTAIASLFTIFNKKLTMDNNPAQLFQYELSGGFVVLTLLLPVYFHFAPPEVHFVPGLQDFVLLFLLATVCTAFMYILQLQALREVSPFTMNLSYNMEPLYSILLAALFLGEAKEFTGSFYIGWR